MELVSFLKLEISSARQGKSSEQTELCDEDITTRKLNNEGQGYSEGTSAWSGEERIGATLSCILLREFLNKCVFDRILDRFDHPGGTHLFHLPFHPTFHPKTKSENC